MYPSQPSRDWTPEGKSGCLSGIWEVWGGFGENRSPCKEGALLAENGESVRQNATNDLDLLVRNRYTLSISKWVGYVLPA